eukprot:1803697-Amphidinium_carterae.1
MEATTALQVAVADAPLGACIYGAVRDYQGRQQGTALFIVCGAPTVEGTLVRLPVQFGGSSDPYYRWWGQKTSGPPAGGARMQVVVSQTDYQDPDENKVVLRGVSILDTVKLCNGRVGERLGAWDAMAMKCMKMRLRAILKLLPQPEESMEVPPGTGIPALQQALGGGAPEAVPEEMMSREELIEQLAAARMEGRQAPERKKREDKQSTSKLGEVLVARVVSKDAGASLGVRSKRTAAQAFMKALANKAVDSEGSDEEDMASARPQKIAKATPGKLAHGYLTEMYKQSHMSLGLADQTESDFPRVAVFYLTTVLTRRLPNLTQNMRSWREAQTLAGVLDCLSSGEVCQAMDIVCQRLKALELATSQGHWQQARWLELLGTDTTGAVQPGEVRAAQRREKLDRALGNPSQSSGGMASTSIPHTAQAQAQTVPP